MLCEAFGCHDEFMLHTRMWLFSLHSTHSLLSVSMYTVKP